MTVTYTTVANVRALLQISSSSTTPTDAQIEAFINRAEDYIDNFTDHAWRSTSVTNEYRDIPSIDAYETYNGIPIYLRHRAVITFATGSGDKLEIWNGTTYEDYAITKTQGRANDFWFDNVRGVLYLRTGLAPGRNMIRITYHYGETSVPKDIEDAATMLAAINVTTADDRVAQIAKVGSPQVNLGQKVEIWKKRIESILDERREVRVINL